MRRGLLLSGSAGITLSTLAPAQAQTGRTSRRAVKSATLAPAPLSVMPSTARIAIERARQMEAQGIASLAAVQFRAAVAAAPASVEATRELARFYTRQQRWEEAAESWRQVLFLKRGTADAEATTQIARAQDQLLRHSDALPSSRGQSRVPASTSPATVSSASMSSTRAAAQNPPRFAQAPETQAPEAAVGTETPFELPAPAASTPLTDPAVELPAPAEPPAPAFALPPIAAPAQAPPATQRSAAPAPARTASRSTTVTAIPFRAPARVARRVSASNVARAWPLVNRAGRELTAGRAASALRLYQQAFAIDPTNAYAGPGIGTSYVILGRFNDAAAAYRRYLAIKPNDPQALRGLADSLTYALKYREALGVNNAILARNPRDFASAYQNAQITTYLRAYPQSDRFFTTATTLKPNDAEVWTAWGESLSYRLDPRAASRFQRALALSPNSARALTGFGNFYAYTGQFAAAIPRYRAALRVKPNDPATQVALADALTYSGEPQTAVPLYRAALQRQPNNAAARLGLGRALVYAGNSESGAAELTRVRRADPGNNQALEALALAQTDYAPRAAIESYQTILSRQSSPAARARTLASIGDLRARNNEFPQALEAYRQAARLAPSDPKINLAFAQFLASQKDFDAARPVIQEVLSRQPNNAQALALQVQIESGSGNLPAARALATRLENLTPATVDDALSLAEALRATGNTASARRVLERAATTVSDPASALRLANATRDAGDYAGAIPLYSRLLRSDPRNVQARLSYAETLIYQKNIEAAQAQLRQVLQAEPNNVEAKVLMSTASLRAETDAGRATAVEEAREILKTDPNNVRAINIVGEVLTSRQQFAEAVTEFRRAVQADPNNLQARLGLARNLYYSRDIEGSIAEYRELIRRVPTDTLPRLELAQLFLDRNRFSDAEALFNEVLALRRGLPLGATARWKVENRSSAKLNPLSLLNSTLRGKTAKNGRTSRRVIVDAPSRRAVVNAPSRRVVVNAPTRRVVVDAPARGVPTGSRRVLMAQGNLPITGSSASPTPSSSSPLPLPSDATAPDAATGDAPANGDAAGATTSSNPDLGGTASGNALPALPAPSTTPDATGLPDLPTTVIPAPSAALEATSVEPVVADQGTALRGLGEVRRRQERFGEALEYFTQALTLNPNDLAARLGVAQSLRGQLKFEEALRETERILALDPTDLQGRILRAQLLGDTGQPQLAQQELDALVQGLPEEPSLQTYFTLTQAFNALRNFNASLQLLEEAQKLYPQEAGLPRLRAEALTYAGREAEAVALYDQLIAADPQDVDAVLGKARVYNYSDKTALAEPIYRRVLEIQPTNYQAITELADVLGRRTNYPESIALYVRAIEANPTDLATRVQLARVQRYAGSNADAEATLTQVLEADPRYVSALVERGVLRGTVGSYASGIADLQAALAVAPTDLNAQFGLAEVQGYAGQYPESIAGYRALLARDPQNLRARTQLSQVLSYAGRNDEALTEINLALQAAPTDVSARLAKAEILGRTTRTAESVALYNAVLAEDPQNLRARTGLADAYVVGRQYDDAVRVYDALIAANPTNTTYRIQRARTLGYGGRALEAIRALREVVTADPTNLQARLALAEAGANSGDQTLVRDAIADYRQILRADSTNVAAQVGLGRALSYSGNNREAQRVLQAVLQANPTNPEARLALAESQRFAGSPFIARDNYNQVLATDPTNAQARSGLRAARRETVPRVTVAGSNYNDTNGVNLRSFNYGATLPTRAGTIGVIAERGRFTQGATQRDRSALSLLLARSFGPVQARLILTRLKYDGAPNRTLYDLLLNNVRGPRERYFVGVARRDVFESDAAVTQGITATLLRAGFAYPLGRRFDFEGQLTRYRYSDNNTRTSIAPSIFYRFRPTNPTLRVGLGYLSDDTSQLRTIYYTPQNFSATSILADYVVDQGRLRYGLFAAHPLTNATGDGGINRPADTLFGFLNYDLTDALELFAEGGIVRSPDFRSNTISGGANYRF